MSDSNNSPAATAPRIRAEGASDTGLVRAHNEDYYLLVPEHRLFLLADGMGGHNAGEIASRVALESARDFFIRTVEQADVTWPYPLQPGISLESNRVLTSLRAANSRVLEEAGKDCERTGMGTTAVALLVADGKSHIANLGDSRAYRLRGGELTQVTRDHSLVAEQVAAGAISEAEAEASPYKNVITRACGIREGILPDIFIDEVQPGDIFVMCSDGLSNMVSDLSIAQVVDAHRGDLATACWALIEEANKAGGEDNITVVLVSVDAI